jgi:glycosyltransferase involved in cell wall biosynthesis
MINIISIKEDHTMYDVLRTISEGVDYDINILGLDSPGGIDHPIYLNPKNFELPFLLYLEEPSTFDGITREEGFERPPTVAKWDAQSMSWSLKSTYRYPVPLEVLSLFLDNKNFMGFVSHLKDTCRIIFTKYKTNCYHLPLSSSKKNLNLIKQRIASLNEDRPINLYTSSSWGDTTGGNFFNRGGRIIDELAIRLLDDNTNIKLTYRTPLAMKNCLASYPTNMDLITEYLSRDKLEELMSRQDIYLLPSRQVHSVSLTEAFSYGMPSVVSTGWGISEFCVDGFNSLMHSIEDFNWSDKKENGDWVPEKYLNNIIPRIKNLCEDRELLIKKSENILAWYDANHSRENHRNNFINLMDHIVRLHGGN